MTFEEQRLDLPRAKAAEPRAAPDICSSCYINCPHKISTVRASVTQAHLSQEHLYNSTVLFRLIGLTINCKHAYSWIQIFLDNGSITWKNPTLYWTDTGQIPMAGGSRYKGGSVPAHRECRLQYLAWFLLSHPTPAAPQSYTKRLPRTEVKKLVFINKREGTT